MATICYKTAGGGDPIVFLHGVGGGAESWDAQLRAFGDTHRVLAWDMPGYGGSPALPSADFEAWSKVLAEWLDGLSIGRCVLVGHSIGGMIAQTFMKRHAPMVSRLVLSATSPAFGSPNGEFQKNFVRTRIGPLDDGATMAELAARFVPQLLGRRAGEEVRQAAISVMSRVPSSSYRSAMEALVTFDERENLKNIKVPCLLVAGEDDTAAPVRVMERMSEKLANARLAVVPGMGHLGNMEMTQVYNDILSGFLDESTEHA